MSPFDYPFDRTFRGELTPPGDPPILEGCRSDGVQLTWLTLQGGWEFWLFEGSVQTGQSTDSRGQAKQGGLVRHIQKETARAMVLHTANLTERQADAIGTLRESISVYWLRYDATGLMDAIPVTVPAGDSPLWDTQTYTNNFSTVITLPSRRSQRL